MSRLLGDPALIAVVCAAALGLYALVLYAIVAWPWPRHVAEASDQAPEPAARSAFPRAGSHGVVDIMAPVPRPYLDAQSAEEHPPQDSSVPPGLAGLSAVPRRRVRHRRPRRLLRSDASGDSALSPAETASDVPSTGAPVVWGRRDILLAICDVGLPLPASVQFHDRSTAVPPLMVLTLDSLDSGREWAVYLGAVPVDMVTDTGLLYLGHDPARWLGWDVQLRACHHLPVAQAGGPE